MKNAKEVVKYSGRTVHKDTGYGVCSSINSVGKRASCSSLRFPYLKNESRTMWSASSEFKVKQKQKCSWKTLIKTWYNGVEMG